MQHQYRFYSIGIDGAGNTEPVHVAPGDVIFTQRFALPAVLQATGLTVENGAAERFYIRYLDIGFNESDSQSGGQLTQIAGSVATADPLIQLYKFDLQRHRVERDSGVAPVAAVLEVIDHAIEIDFGAAGSAKSRATPTRRRPTATTSWT